MRKPQRLAAQLARAGIITLSVASTTVLAQQQQQEQPAKIDKIEVTGSSIKRIEGETALPVQVITREEIQRTGATTVEQILQTISAASSSGGLLTSSATGATTGSISAVSLRGLTSLRTLVLVNGRRIAPYGIGFTGDSVSVDVNSIPVSAIERVEVLKDGASAVYGSDAIAGVINFIIRKDFTGVEATAEYGDTTQGGAAVTRVSGAFGIGDLSKNRYNVMLMAAYQKEDPLFGRDRPFARSSINASENNDGTSGNSFPANIVLPSGATRNPGFPNNCAPSVVSPVFTALGGRTCRFDPSPLMALFPDAKRMGVFLTGKLAITDNLEAFLEASFNKNEQTTELQPVPLSDQFALPPNNPLFNVDPYNGFSTIVLRPSSPFYPAAFIRSQIGANDPLPEVLVRYRSVLTGNRSTTDFSESPRVSFGVRGNVANWDFDTAFLYSESKVRQQVNDGFPSQSRILPILNSGRVNFFGPNTPEIVAELRATNFTGDALKFKTSITSVSAKGSRELMQLAGGPLAVAVGGEIRKDKYRTDPNPTIQTGDISGFGGNFLPVDKSRDVKAVFGELSVPVIKGLEATAAVRYDDYQDNESSTTPKFGLRWQPVKPLLLRASFGKGFRAPSLLDLFGPQLTGVSPNGLNDPLRCPTTGSSNDCATQFSIITGGNPQLKPEESDNKTIGFVFEPTSNVSIAVDYFDIVLKETIINGITPGVILGDLNQYGNLVTRGPRDPNFPNLPGPITQINQLNINQGKTKVQGIDIDGRVGFPLANGSKITVAMNGTYFKKYDGENPDGTFTSAISTPNVATGGLIARWKHYLSVTWTRGPWDFTLAQNFQLGYTDLCGNLEPFVVGECGVTKPPRNVGNYEYYDVQGTYNGFKNLKLTLGARNVLDRDPPYTNTGGTVSFQAGYDPNYADPRGRFVYGRVTYSFK